jgi:hypothetical protein
MALDEPEPLPHLVRRSGTRKMSAVISPSLTFRTLVQSVHRPAKLSSGRVSSGAKQTGTFLPSIWNPSASLSGKTRLCCERLVWRLAACKGSVGDRHGRPLWTAHSYDLGVELLGKRLDDTGAKPRFRLSEHAVRFSNSVVGDRKFPIRPGNFVGDRDLAVFRFCIEGVL